MKHKPTDKSMRLQVAPNGVKEINRELNQREAMLGLGAVVSGASPGEGKLKEEPFKSPKWRTVR